MSVATVKTHLTHIYAKTGVTSNRPRRVTAPSMSAPPLEVWSPATQIRLVDCKRAR